MPDNNSSKRVLVIGAGSIGTRHLRVIHGLGYEVAGCDTQADAFQSIREHIANLATYNDLTKALAEKPDYVVVATPPAAHAENTVAALEAGAHVLCEKPMADTLDSCDRMISAADRCHRILHIGFTNRYHPGVRRIKDAVDSGRLGKVLFGCADVGTYFTLMCSRSRHQANLYGALLLDYTHQLDYMPWIMGSSVVRLYAVGRAFGDFELKSNPNMISMIMEHANDTVTEIHLDYCRHPQQASTAVTGDRGYIKTDFATNRVLTGSLAEGTTQEETLSFERDELFREQFRQFVAAAAGRPALIVSGTEGRRSTRLVEAALKSLQSRSPVEIRDKV